VSDIIFFDKNDSQIGLKVRNQTSGPELDLVNRFVNQKCNEFLLRNKSQKLAVFIEPMIDSGFPDIVFATYRPEKFEFWNSIREDLTIEDYKLLSFLIRFGAKTSIEIGKIMGLSSKSLLMALERLLDCKLVKRNSKKWCAVRLNSFAISKIEAVEAKMSDPQKVLPQAIINTRFSTHSYALLGSNAPHDSTVNIFAKFGLGLLYNGKRIHRVLQPNEGELFKDYQSIMFNEWICKTLVNPKQGEKYANF
jgi:hypothetical protein